jgi:hypothetical protein
LTLAQTITCENPDTKTPERETILWRGRSADYWNWLPKNSVHIFIHRDDFDRAIFKNDLLRVIPRSELPPMEPYTSIRQLYSRIRAGKVNVVFEPTNYTITDRIKKMIQKRGITGDELFKSSEVDPVIFWFEFMDWLVHNKNPKFITIIFDEADELFPTSPGGARWHLNLWAKDVIKDLRRRRISLFMASHGYQDLDGRIKPKIQYKIYMKGCVTPPESIVNRRAPIMLEPGVYYIERDGWGLHAFEKIPERTIMLTYLTGIDERDDFGDSPDLPPGPDKIPPIPPDKIPPVAGNGDAVNLSIPPECITKDKDGKIISIDLSRFNGLEGVEKKRNKRARKKSTYSRRSYILKRSTEKDGAREQARAYDEKVKSGAIDEQPMPKPERNDNTTDEVDK